MSRPFPPRSPPRRWALAGAALAACALFTALGTWQLQRRTWKHELIARVDERVHEPAVAPPGPGQWGGVRAATHEYLRVRVAGRFLHDRETLVQAATALGGGYWVLTPLQQADGTVVLVNRGFVAPELRAPAARADALPGGTVEVTGLLRLSEPGGTWLRRNDPAHERWYSRDVAAIAAARQLGTVAPYFVDAEAAPPGSAAAPGPVGGLTVVAFNDNHLVYALTWYGLALMVLLGLRRAVQDERAAPPAQTP